MTAQTRAKISIRARIVRAITGAYLRRIDAQTADVHVARRRWHAVARLQWTAWRVRLEYAEMQGLRVAWLTPKRSVPGKLLLYLHGGAYIMGDCVTHRQLVSHLARYAGVRALLPEYRLAPEHPFPAGVEDAVGLYRALLADGFEANDIVVAGDSAGGGLTMAMLLSLRDAGDRLPAAVCLLSPWLDLAASGETMSTNADKDPWFKREDIAVVAKYYCNDEQLQHPLVSPVYADLSGLPPLYIQVGGDEILLSDSTRAADKVKTGGGEVGIEIWPRMWHVFQLFVHLMPESRRAIRKLGEFIRQKLEVDSALKR